MVIKASAAEALLVLAKDLQAVLQVILCLAPLKGYDEFMGYRLYHRQL